MSQVKDKVTEEMKTLDVLLKDIEDGLKAMAEQGDYVSDCTVLHIVKELKNIRRDIRY